MRLASVVLPLTVPPVPATVLARGNLAAACRNDVARFCPDAAGDRDALRTCMRAHAAELSDGCKDAIAAWRLRRRGRPPAR